MCLCVRTRQCVDSYFWYYLVGSLLCFIHVIILAIVFLFLLFYFFFFKQKTAYEMRISDWSSDVCSSDLKVHKLRAALRSLRQGDRYLIFIDADIEPPSRLMGRLLFPLVRGKADIVTGYRLLLPEASMAATLEIGRASCRERVCQYV